jgi:hypothetical protein
MDGQTREGEVFRAETESSGATWTGSPKDVFSERNHHKPRLALNNITAGVHERENENRTRVAGLLEIQGVLANQLNLFREGAVSFIDWLGLFLSLLKRPLPSSETLRSGSRCRRRGNCRSWGWCCNGSGCRRGTERRRWTGMRSGTRSRCRPWRRSGRWGWSRSVQFRARISSKAAIFSRCNKDHAVGQQGGRVKKACCV